MQFQIIAVIAVATLVIIGVYLLIGWMLPGRWRKKEVEESEAFTIDSVNVLIGVLFSVLLAFVIGSVLEDYDKARSDTQQEANAIGAVYGFARGIPEPAQSVWKRDSRNYVTLIIHQDWPLMQHQQSSEAAWKALTTLRDAPGLSWSTRASRTSCGTALSAGPCWSRSSRYSPSRTSPAAC